MTDFTKFNYFYMDVAIRVAELSHCNRRQVGAVIVKNNNIISIGYNGTAKNEDNCCEDEDGLTKFNVVHAESNALQKLMRSNESSVGADIYTTLQPCLNCANLIINAEISTVYYHKSYRCQSGMESLSLNGVNVIKIS